MDPANALLQPVDLQAELDSLLRLRRRSLSAPNEARIDPDLLAKPADAPSAASTSTSPPTSPTGLGSSLIPSSSDSDVPLTAAFSDLFWLPARLHPEIAPQEFRDFLKEQTKPENLARRTSFNGNNGNNAVGRRRSMLSKQYNPENAIPSEERTTAPDRDMNGHKGGLEGLTIADLQRFEQLAQANAPLSLSDAAERQQLQTLLSRSLSFGSPSEDKPLIEGDSPLLVPAPGSIQRRNARTKIRKPSMLGDGNSHRFGPSRRGTRMVSSDSTSSLSLEKPEDTNVVNDESFEDNQAGGAESAAGSRDQNGDKPSRPASAPNQVIPSLSLITSNLGDQTSSATATPQSANSLHSRSLSSDSFLDAYTSANSPVENLAKANATPSALPQTFSSQSQSAPSNQTNFDREQPQGEAVHHRPTKSTGDLLSAISNTPTSQPAVLPHIHPQAVVAGYPPHSYGQHQQPQPIPVPLPVASTPVSSSPSPAPVAGPSHNREGSGSASGQKKSAWARLGLSKSSTRSSADEPTEEDAHQSPVKKGKKPKKSLGSESPSGERASPEAAREKDKDGFFGTLFTKNRRPESENFNQNLTKTVSPTASGMFAEDGTYYNFYRLPIHVERAIYRLSHIKLANPRRALYEQVLISNLMFWYLSQQAAAYPKVADKLAPQNHNHQQTSQHIQQQPSDASKAVAGQPQSTQSNYDLPTTHANDMYVANPAHTTSSQQQQEAYHQPGPASQNSWRDAKEQQPYAAVSRSMSMPGLSSNVPSTASASAPTPASASSPAAKPPLIVETRKLVADDNFEVVKRPRSSSKNTEPQQHAQTPPQLAGHGGRQQTESQNSYTNRPRNLDAKDNSPNNKGKTHSTTPPRSQPHSTKPLTP